VSQKYKTFSKEYGTVTHTHTGLKSCRAGDRYEPMTTDAMDRGTAKAARGWVPAVSNA